MRGDGNVIVQNAAQGGQAGSTWGEVLILPTHHPHPLIPHRHQALVAQLLKSLAEGARAVLGIIRCGSGNSDSLISGFSA